MLERVLYLLSKRIYSHHAAPVVNAPDLEADKVRNILVLELAKIGDLISTIPALWVVRQNFNQARITVLCQNIPGRLLELSGIKLEFMRIERGFKDILFLLSTVRAIRRKNFDLLFIPSPSAIHWILACLSGIKTRLGYLVPLTSKTPFLYEIPVASRGFKLHHKEKFVGDNLVERALRPLWAIGLGGTYERPTLDIPQEMLEPVALSLNRLRKKFDKLIVLHALKNDEGREWPVENYIKLMENIRKNYEVLFVLIGSGEDRKNTISIQDKMGDQVMVVLDEDLKKIAVLLELSDLFIGCDSGPLHLAAAVGCQTIGMFGPAPPHLTAPAACTRSIYKQVECSPCKQNGCERSPSCMELITPREVARIAEEILSAEQR